MERAMQGTPLDVKPSDLDPESRPRAALINVTMYYVSICLRIYTSTSAPLTVMLMSAAGGLLCLTLGKRLQEYKSH